MTVIDQLVPYPIKGCGGVSVEQVRLGPAGLEHDRSFMVVGDNGVLRSQRW